MMRHAIREDYLSSFKSHKQSFSRLIYTPQKRKKTVVFILFSSVFIFFKMPRKHLNVAKKYYLCKVNKPFDMVWRSE